MSEISTQGGNVIVSTVRGAAGVKGCLFNDGELNPGAKTRIDVTTWCRTQRKRFVSGLSEEGSITFNGVMDLDSEFQKVVHEMFVAGSSDIRWFRVLAPDQTGTERTVAEFSGWINELSSSGATEDVWRFSLGITPDEFEFGWEAPA